MTASESKLVLSPLTDPRSLASTLFVHAALLLIASLAAWTVSSPQQETLPSRDARRARPGRQPGRRSLPGEAPASSGARG